MNKITLFGLVLFLLSCTNTDKTNNTESVQQLNNQTFPIQALVIGDEEEEGWGTDIRLSIVSVSETDTSKLYTAISNYQDKKLGLLVAIPKQKEGDKGLGSGIVLKSIGSESDYLLQTLATLYKQKSDTTLKFTNSVLATYINLDEFAKSLGAKNEAGYQTEYQYKLFYEGNTEGQYAELYMNINPTEHWIELAEKDEEYRPVIIKVFTKKPSY